MDEQLREIRDERPSWTKIPYRSWRIRGPIPSAAAHMRIEGEVVDQSQPKLSLGRKWNAARPTKTVVFWSCVASMVVTMIVGFTWGGWVTGGTALRMAEAFGEDAVTKRLAPMCVARFNADPQKVAKLEEMKGINTWEQAQYVKRQGWATMPGEQEPGNKVAQECGKLVMASSSA